MSSKNKHVRTALLNVMTLILSICLPINFLNAQNTQIPEVTDTNFVMASIIVAEPGDVLYSTVGHAGIHMKCPEHNLDYVFSYESEDVRNKVLQFLAGRLRMGMAAIPYQDYLDAYRSEGRGVREYTLYLPVDVKRNLWRVLDNHMMEGMNLPYDYIKRGCAYSTLQLLIEGLDTLKLEFGPWPSTFNLTRRELFLEKTMDFPWTRVFLNLIGNGQLDYQCSNMDKVIIPSDLIEVLQNATLNGNHIISREPSVLLPDNHVIEAPVITPAIVSLVILFLTIISSFSKRRFMDYFLLALQTILGLVTVYLVFFSKLVCTEWSWLIIPFNPLPLIFWRWRQKWCLTYAIIISIWILTMWLWPHTLTDTAYIVLALAIVVSYINIFRTSKKLNKK